MAEAALLSEPLLAPSSAQMQQMTDAAPCGVVSELGALRVPSRLYGTHAGLFHLLRMQALLASQAPAASAPAPRPVLRSVPETISNSLSRPHSQVGGVAIDEPAARLQKVLRPVSLVSASIPAITIPAAIVAQPMPRPVAPPVPRAVPPVEETRPPASPPARSWQEMLMSDTFLFRPAAQG